MKNSNNIEPSNSHHPFTHFLTLERDDQELALLTVQDDEEGEVETIVANSGDELLLEVPYSPMLEVKTLSDQRLVITEGEDTIDEILAEEELSSMGHRVYRCTLEQFGGTTIAVHFEWMESEPQAMFARLLQSLTLTKKAGTVRKSNVLQIRVNEDQSLKRNNVACIKVLQASMLKEVDRFKLSQFIQGNFSDQTIGECLLVRYEREHITEARLKESTSVKFDETQSKKERLKIVYQALKRLDQSFDYLVINLRSGLEGDLFDIMLHNTNNTSSDPSLQAAAALDETLRDFTMRFINLKVSPCLTAPFIDSEVALAQVMTAIKKEALERLYLQEYFLINIVEHVHKLESYMKDSALMAPESDLNKGLRDFIKSQLGFKCKEIDLLLRNMANFGVESFGVTVDIDFAACLLIDEGLTKPRKQAIREFTWLLTQLNQQLEARVKEVIEECLENIEAEISYHRLRQRNIKVCEDFPIVIPFFTKFHFQDGRSLVCLKSGEVCGSKASVVEQPSVQWLRRNKIILNSGVDYHKQQPQTPQRRLSQGALDMLNF